MDGYVHFREIIVYYDTEHGHSYVGIIPERADCCTFSLEKLFVSLLADLFIYFFKQHQIHVNHLQFLRLYLLH